VSRSRVHRVAVAGAFAAALVGIPSALGSAWLPWSPAAHDVGAAATADIEPLHSVPADQPAKGLVHRGLQPGRKGTACAGEYDVVGTGRCSHGPDEVPAGLAVKRRAAPVAATRAEPTLPKLATPAPDRGVALLADAAPAAAEPVVGPNGVVCDGDGTTGKRVQVLYVRAAGTASRFATYEASFRSWAAGVDTIYDASAQETGGHRHLRYVTTADCQVDVREVEVPAGQLDDFGKTIAALDKLGYNRTDRKYMVFAESKVYCGIGTFMADDQSSAKNRSNSGPSYGRSDTGCWAASVAAHELGHNLGAVSNSAPNSSKAGHCVDDYDVMCYVDTNTTVVKIVCSDRAHENRLDCNHDDYYSTDPQAGSYLATHWNVANNQFLIAGEAAPGTPGPSATTPAPTATAPKPATPGPTPTTAGPGPTSAGPTSAGPTSAGPTSTGPTSAGPTSAGPTPTTRGPGAPGPTAPNPTTTGSGDNLKALTVGDLTPTSVRFSWPAAATGTDYGVVVGGSTLGTVRSAGVTIVGLTPGTTYRVRITAGGSPYTAEAEIRTPAAATPAPGAWFTLTNAQTGAVADLYGARSADRTPLVAVTGTGAANQQWQLDPAGRLTSKATGKCVAPLGAARPGTPLVQVDCAAAPGWKLTRTEAGVAVSTADGDLVAGLGGSFGGRRMLTLQRPTGATHQAWAASAV
jgi:Ricin-type beta-trefoil lectin domain-like/Metallo-peptidase family M12B Reprolysin-like